MVLTENKRSLASIDKSSGNLTSSDNTFCTVWLNFDVANGDYSIRCQLQYHIIIFDRSRGTVVKKNIRKR